MQPQQAPQGQQKAAEAQRAELERRSKDSYKVYNPTNQDFQVVLNAAVSPEIWTVPAHDEAIVPRYVREKYFEEMSQKIITTKSDRLVIEENERRMKAGFQKMSINEDQPKFESQKLKIMMGKREQIIKILDRGLYKEYGVTKQGQLPVNSRESLATFDPGINLDGEVKVDGAPPVAPVNPPIPENPPVGTGTVAASPINQPYQNEFKHEIINPYSTPPLAPADPGIPGVVEEDDEEENGESN